MSLFGYQNKIRLCLTIFASLIFLDIVAFFDTLLSSIVSFQHFEDTPCYKQFLPGLEEPEKSADAEKSEILRWFQICKS